MLLTYSKIFINIPLFGKNMVYLENVYFFRCSYLCEIKNFKEF